MGVDSVDTAYGNGVLRAIITSMPEFDDLPPFALVQGLALRQETECIERVRAHLAGRSDPAAWTVDRICARHGWTSEDQVCSAAVLIARDIDAGILARPLPYHHCHHFCDVVLSAHYIGLLQAFTDETLRLLMLAALIHDIGHDGGVNADHPFRLERQSMALARSYLDRAGVSDTERESVAAMVMATDVVFGLPRAREWFAHVSGQGPEPVGDEPVEAFALFRRRASLAPAAIALSEADALASAGLSDATADIQEQRIADEVGLRASVIGKLAYLERFFPTGFLVATRFNPNLERLRRRARRALARDDGE